MSFEPFTAHVELPDDCWAAFPEVQIYLSQEGKELRIVIVPTEERFFINGVVQDQPEVLYLHQPSVFLFGDELV